MVKQGYDPNKDKELWVKTISISVGMEIIVSVNQYEGSKPKIGVVRRLASEQFPKGQFKAIGRMTMEEVQKMLPVLEEALQNIPKSEE